MIAKRGGGGASAGRRAAFSVAIAAFVAAGVFAITRPAQAWICERTQDGNNVSAGPAIGWRAKRQLTYTLNASGTAQLSNDAAFSALRQSFAVWAYSQLRSDQTDPTCSAHTVPGYPNQTDLTFTELPSTNANNVGFNYLNPDANENILVFRDFVWPHQKNEPTATGDIIALTTTTYNQLTGEIFDSDIEFNSARFTFTTGNTDIETDLMNTATHEIGHFLGFAHSTDPNATMFFSASSNETLKRYLSCDDAAILWFRYPAGDPNQGQCDPNNIAASCGYCQPATPLKYDPHVTVLGKNAGLSQAISCQAVPEAGFAWVAAAAVARHVRVRRRRR